MLFKSMRPLRYPSRPPSSPEPLQIGGIRFSLETERRRPGKSSKVQSGRSSVLFKVRRGQVMDCEGSFNAPLFLIHPSQFRDIFLMIPGMNGGENVDHFCQGLKPHIKIEVLKAGARSMDEDARIALKVNSAMFGSGMLPFQAQGRPYFDSRSDGPPPTSTEIGNVERQRNPFGKGSSRRKDLRSNACFIWHMEICPAWKHDGRKPRNGRRL